MKKIVIFFVIVIIGVILYGYISIKNFNLYDNNSYTQRIKISSIDEENELLDVSIVGLPLNISSDEYLVFPIGYPIRASSGSKIGGILSNSKPNYLYDISINRGNVKNILFRNKSTDNSHYLTDKDISIQALNQVYMYENGERELSDFLTYKITSVDNPLAKENIDRNINLYVGTNDGKLFKQISKPNESVLDYKVLERERKIVFRTITDSNKDGVLDIKDNIKVYETIINNKLETKQLLF